MEKSSGIGFLGLLAVLFIGLKLTGHIAWSWWLVLLPLYIVPLIIIGIAAVGGLILWCVNTWNGRH